MEKKEESVSCVIFNKERDGVLLIKRRDIPVWVLPGGGIESGESPESAAVREAEEETGLKVAIAKKIAFYHPKNRLTHHTHFYECTPITGKITTGSETKEIDFFPLESLPKKLVPFYRSWIEDAVHHSGTVLEKTIEKTSYWTFVHYLLCHPLLVFRFLLMRMGIHINS